jgi:hypothetical protein
MSSTPAITAYGSIDIGNVGANWTVTTSCYVPVIDSIRPAAAKKTAVFTMYGTNFIAAQGLGSLKLGAVDLGTAKTWSNTVITDTVPSSAVLGNNKAIITNDAETKDTVNFRVTNPAITIP